MRDVRSLPDRTEILRRVLAMVRDTDDFIIGNTTAETVMKSVLVPANTFKIFDLFSFEAAGFLNCAGAGTVTLRMKFGGVTFSTPAYFTTLNSNANDAWHIRGLFSRQSPNDPSHPDALQYNGTITFRDNTPPGELLNFRGEIDAPDPDYTIDNMFEITGQKNTAGTDSVVCESFVVYKHPRI